jgi:hypothetical protein
MSGIGMTFRTMIPAAFLCLVLSPVPAWSEAMAPMALNSVGAVPAKIQGALVEDVHGSVLGRVADVETDAKGEPLRVGVVLEGGPTVFLDTASLGYDETANILVTALNQGQLTQMAGERRG